MTYVPVSKRRPCATQGCSRYAVKPKRKCATCLRESKKTAKAKARNNRAQTVYGLKDGDYQKLWDNAPFGPGTCYICGGKGSGKLHIEHNHKTGAVRGLACYTCNTILLSRLGKDSWERLEFLLTNAVKYLKDEPAQQILSESYEDHPID